MAKLAYIILSALLSVVKPILPEVSIKECSPYIPFCFDSSRANDSNRPNYLFIKSNGTLTLGRDSIPGGAGNFEHQRDSRQIKYELEDARIPAGNIGIQEEQEMCDLSEDCNKIERVLYEIDKRSKLVRAVEIRDRRIGDKYLERKNFRFNKSGQVNYYEVVDKRTGTIAADCLDFEGINKGKLEDFICTGMKQAYREARIIKSSSIDFDFYSQRATQILTQARAHGLKL